jgi:hypothetical protein
MKCTYNLDGKDFETFPKLYNYLLENYPDKLNLGNFSIFSLKTSLQSAVVDHIPSNKDYKKNQDLLETGGPGNTPLISSKTGRQVVSVYNVENRISNEMENWLQKHPMNKEGDIDYNNYKKIIEIQIQEDELKGKFFSLLHKLIKYKLQDSTQYEK